MSKPSGTSTVVVHWYRDRGRHHEIVLDQLHGAQWFTFLDLQPGYHQVRLREDDFHQAAFSTRYSLFETIAIPFGLCSAPTHFQRMMDHYLRELIELDVCVVYIDGILIYSRRSEEDHIATVQSAFKIIEAAQLVVNLPKCRVIRHRHRISGSPVMASVLLPS